MKIGTSIISALLSGLIVAGCSQGADPKPYTYSKVFTGEISRSWRFNRLQYKEENKADVNYSESDLIQILGSCVMDDLYTFYANADKTFQIGEGASKCNAGDPDIYVTETWSFNNSNATLEMVFPILSGDKRPYFVRAVDSKEMTTETFLDQDNKSSYRIHFVAAGDN